MKNALGLRSREEAILVTVGIALPLFLLGLYVWVLSGLAMRLSQASASGTIDPAAKVQFNLDVARDVLRSRGLLQ